MNNIQSTNQLCREQLAEILRKNMAKYMTYASSKLADKNLAGDVVADAYLKVYRIVEKRTIENLEAYFFLAIKNTALDYNRSNQREQRILKFHFSVETFTTEFFPMEDKSMEKMWKDIERLLDSQSLTLLRLWIAEYSYADIASEVELSIHQVRGRLFRIKEKLRSIYCGKNKKLVAK